MAGLAERETLVSFADALERGDASLLAEYRATYEKAYAEHAGVKAELAIGDQRDEQRIAAPVAVPPSPPRAPGPDETSFLAASALGTIEPVPFASGGAASAPQRLGELAPHESVGDTGFIDASVLGEAVMPFRPEDDAPPEPSPAASVDETAFVAAVSVEEALPISGEAAPPPTASQVPAEAHPEVGGTSYVRMDDGNVPDAPLPFASTPRGQLDLGGLSLQQLAALEVEVAHAVGRVPEVLEHFGVTLQQYWAAKATLPSGRRWIRLSRGALRPRRPHTWRGGSTSRG